MTRILFLLLLLTACSEKIAISNNDFLNSNFCIKNECSEYIRNENNNGYETVRYKIAGDSTGIVHIIEIKTYNNIVSEILIATPPLESGRHDIFMDFIVNDLLNSFISSKTKFRKAKEFFEEQVYTERSIYDQSSYPYFKVGAYKMTAGTADIGMYEHAKKYNYVMLTLDE